MRIVLHAGLHKSGTTSIQGSWRHSYEGSSSVWYPDPGQGAPGHHRLIRPYLSAFTEGLSPDLKRASVAYRNRSRRGARLTDVVVDADVRGVSTLVLSSEDLARLRPQDADGLGQVFRGHEVIVAITMTRPAHRWAATWQMLVKRGLSSYPAAASDQLLEFIRLRHHGVAELLEALPGSSRVIRLVRPDPADPQLAASLADALSLPAVAAGPQPVRNVSIGTDVEIVRRLTSAGRSQGLDERGRLELQQIKDRGFTHHSDPSLRERYDLPSQFAGLAEFERDWLSRWSGEPSHVLLDPQSALAEWTDLTMPSWYENISEAEASIPGLP